jgi:hypothetical protein
MLETRHEFHESLKQLEQQTLAAWTWSLSSALLQDIRCAELMGDQCVNIVKLVLLSGYEAPKDKGIVDTIERMGHSRSQVTEREQAAQVRAQSRPRAAHRSRATIAART